MGGLSFLIGLDWVALSEPTPQQKWSQTSTRPSRCPMASPIRSPSGAGSPTECSESSATRPVIPSPTCRPVTDQSRVHLKTYAHSSLNWLEKADTHAFTRLEVAACAYSWWRSRP